MTERPQFEPRPIGEKAISEALKRAERYRLLNDPVGAESICRDILRVAPKNQDAIVKYILTLTDQFPRGLAGRCERAKELTGMLDDEYARVYYTGIICERRAKAHHAQRSPHSRHVTYHWLREAMDRYEEAIEMRQEGDDAAILRWNACVRILNDDPGLQPRPEDTEPQGFLE